MGLQDLLDYPWSATEPKRCLAGPLAFHQYETDGKDEFLLDESREEFAKSLGLSEVTNQTMRALIRERPAVLADPLRESAGAYTFVRSNLRRPSN